MSYLSASHVKVDLFSSPTKAELYQNQIWVKEKVCEWNEAEEYWAICDNFYLSLFSSLICLTTNPKVNGLILLLHCVFLCD